MAAGTVWWSPLQSRLAYQNIGRAKHRSHTNHIYIILNYAKSRNCADESRHTNYTLKIHKCNTRDGTAARGVSIIIHICFASSPSPCWIPGINQSKHDGLEREADWGGDTEEYSLMVNMYYFWSMSTITTTYEITAIKTKNPTAHTITHLSHISIG